MSLVELLGTFFFFYLAYRFLKNILGMFRPQQPQQRGGFNQEPPQQRYNRTPGKIHVEHIPGTKETPSSHHPTDDDDGEYISFKEIKD